MRRLSFFIIIILFVACSPAPPPTPTPLPTETPTSVPTITPLPTYAPLPTEIPTEVREASLSDIALSQRANIRTVHTAPTLPEVDIYLNNQIVGFGLSYGEATGQADVVAGDYFLRLIPSGGRADDEPLLEVPVSLSKDDELIAMISPEEDMVFFEENLDPLTSRQSRVQIINMIPDFTTAELAREDGQGPAFGAVNYQQQSEAALFNTGDQTLEFTNLIERYETILRARRNYTFVLFGTAAEPDVIEFDVNAPSQTRLSFINLSQAVGEVDVYLNGEQVTQGVGFRTEDSFPTLPVNTYDVTIYETGTLPGEVEPLLRTTITLNPDDEVFALLMGPAFDLRLVTYQDSNQITRADETRITFINTVHDAPRLTEIRNEDLQLTANYGSSTVIEVEAEEHEFEFVTDYTEDDYTIVDLITQRKFEEGVSYLILLTGQPDEEPLIFPREVGAEEAPPIIQDIPEDPQVYLINAIDRRIQVLIDGMLIESDLPPGFNTDSLTLQARDHDIVVSDADTGEAIYNTQRVFQNDNQYTVVVYGDVEQNNFIVTEFSTIIPDPDMMQVGSTLRVINVSLNTARQLALAYDDAADPEDRITNRIATREAQGFTDEPLPLPLSATGFTNLAVPSGEASELMTISSRKYDLFIYDVNTRYVMAIIYNVRLEPGRFYEVIITPGGDFTPYQAFIIEYPQP